MKIRILEKRENSQFATSGIFFEVGTFYKIPNTLFNKSCEHFDITKFKASTLFENKNNY